MYQKTILFNSDYFISGKYYKQLVSADPHSLEAHCMILPSVMHALIPCLVTIPMVELLWNAIHDFTQMTSWVISGPQVYNHN